MPLAFVETLAAVRVNAFDSADWTFGAAVSRPRARITTRSAYSAISAPSSSTRKFFSTCMCLSLLAQSAVVGVGRDLGGGPRERVRQSRLDARGSGQKTERENHDQKGVLGDLGALFLNQEALDDLHVWISSPMVLGAPWCFRW